MDKSVDNSAVKRPGVETGGVTLRIALIGPRNSGKTAVARRLHSTIKAGMKPTPLISINSFDGSTMLFDFFALHLGIIDDVEVVLQVYSAPGNPMYDLAFRMTIHSADAVVFVTDPRDAFLPYTMDGLRSLKSALDFAGRNFDDYPVLFLLNKSDLCKSIPLSTLTAERLEPLGKQMLAASAATGAGLPEALRAATALALAGLTASGGRKPITLAQPPLLRGDENFTREIAAANEIYLRTFSSVTTSYSPHSESFLGAILEKYGLVSASQIKRAMDIQNQAFADGKEPSLDQILVEEKMVSPEETAMAMRLKGLSEVMHEEVLYGKIAVENDFTSFGSVKECLLYQKRTGFLQSLGHLLQESGKISAGQHASILTELSVLHRTETERHTKLIGGRKTSSFTRSLSFESLKRPEVHFGSLAVKNKFITQRQLDECLEMQKNLKQQGMEKYLGVILQEKGYLSNREVELICSSLEAELAKNPIEGYKIEAQLGRGNMGLVYAAKQIKLDRIVALKVLDPKLAMDREFIKRFYKEAKIGAQLNHPNIVQFYDVGESMGYHYISMEYVEGLTVKEILERDKVIEESWALDVMKQVAKALQHAKVNNLIHLDIKPGNIMINDEGLAKLCDLGLAKQVGKPGDDFSSTHIMGSPFYISPEQIERDEEIDQRADIYSLGATMFHMVTGKPPYPGRNAEEIFLKHLTHRIPDARETNPKLSADISALLRKTMAKDKSERHQNHGELIAELKVLTGEAPDSIKARGIGLLARKLSTMLRGKPEERE